MRQHPVASRTLQTALLCLLSAFALAATHLSTAQGRPARDTTAPTVSWKTPAPSATVSGLLWESTNSGPSGPCEATASDDRGIYKIVYYVDSTLLNTEDVAPYNCKFDSTKVSDGSHTLKAVAYDAAGNTATALRTVTVKNATGDTTAPAVTWKTPADGATVSGRLWESANSGLSGPCEAGASDNVGVSKIVYYVDSTLLNTENVAPYNCKFDSTAVADGSHTLKAVAYDAAGNTTSSTRTLTVQNDLTAPTVSWTSPSESATVSGTAVACEAAASDNVAVSKVVFFVDAAQLTTESAAPYTCTFDSTTVADGSHTLKAVAYDAAGNTTSSTRAVTVANTVSTPPPPPPPPSGDSVAPTVSWTTPAESATVSGFMWEAANSGTSGPCEVSASDATGVSKVLFYVDGTLLNQENLGPWNCKFDTPTVPNGPHTLKAVAYDAAGNTSTVQRTVNVQNSSDSVTGKTLVFEENFDSSAVDTNIWAPYYSPGHAGNGLRRPSAFSQQNGQLVITASWDGTNITSGGMKHRKDYTYGTYEFRVRTEADTTGQLSGVVLTWPLSNKKIPDGENDMYETGHSTSRTPFYTYVHYSLDGTTDKQYRFVHNADATQWHIMRMDWTRDSMKFYRDGVLISTLTDTAAIPDNPHHYGLQLDAFSNRALPGPVHMYVDWVRIYQ